MYYGAVRHFGLKWEKFYAGQIIRSLAGMIQSAYGINDNNYSTFLIRNKKYLLGVSAYGDNDKKGFLAKCVEIIQKMRATKSFAVRK